METTFMTIHNLAAEANILYASDSIVEVLGYEPHEVTGRSSFDYFHPDEVPFARGVHDRGVKMDKAAVLHYAQIRSRDGQWVACECVFTIVYDVLVACTSIYRRGLATERRAADAPTIRRLFASSPRDPRYHMLEHLSAKFRSPPQHSLREPRAALILNRFTRTLTVMYATNAVSEILGVSPDQIRDKSFYECMQENCLPDAIRCLESAKANDSIAYLRFWYRDPRRPEDLDEERERSREATHSDSEDGGVQLHDPDEMVLDSDSPARSVAGNILGSRGNSGEVSSGDDHGLYSSSSHSEPQHGTRVSSGERSISHQIPVQDLTLTSGSSSSSALAPQPEQAMQPQPLVRPQPQPEPYEIEAVVSCTSDGLVVILRRARPLIPTFNSPIPAPSPNGLFAAPWGAHPIRPHQFQPAQGFQHGLDAPVVAGAGGPPLEDFMASIRDVAVFAWSLAGINGNIATYGRGQARGEAVPVGGLPVWDLEGRHGGEAPVNQAVESWARRDQRLGAGAGGSRGNSFGDSGFGEGESLASGVARRLREVGRSEGYYWQGPEGWVRNGFERAFGGWGGEENGYRDRDRDRIGFRNGNSAGGGGGNGYMYRY